MLLTSISHVRAAIACVIFATALVPVMAQEKAESGIRFFHGSFEELKAKAASEKKPIFMDAFTSWCGPCKWMAKSVFTAEQVGNFYNAGFICAKVDMEKGEGVELAKRFEVNAYPTLLYLNADGQVIHRALGAREAADFIELGKTALDPERNLAGLQKKYLASPRDFSAAYPYFFQLNDAGGSGLPAELEKWFSGQTKAEWASRSNWKMLYDFVDNTENPAFLHMVANMADYSSRYTADSVSGKARKVFFTDLQAAAYNGDLTRWKKDSAAISGLNLPDGKRFIASTTILQAGDDIGLALSRIMTFMKEFGSNNPSELNEYAWKMFEASENPAQLAAAEGWAKKGLELSGGDYMIHDTYASLLFKNRKLTRAKEEAEKAIMAGKKQGQDVAGTEDLLGRINEELTKAPVSAKKKPAAPGKSKKK